MCIYCKKELILESSDFCWSIECHEITEKIKKLEMQLLVIQKSFLAHQMNDTEKNIYPDF